MVASNLRDGNLHTGESPIHPVATCLYASNQTHRKQVLIMIYSYILSFESPLFTTYIRYANTTIDYKY